MKEYILGESAYGRVKVLCISQDKKEGIVCDKCNEKVRDVTVISTDTSNGEYGDVSICERCIMSILSEFHNYEKMKH